MKNKKWWIFFICIVSFVVVYFLGPKTSEAVYSNVIPSIPSDANSLEKYVSENEAKHKVKEGNEAQIIWINDSLKNKTEYSIVYLHGFSASHYEGYPVHQTVAKKFGCNLYLPRLASHGIDTVEQLLNYSASANWESAKEALFIGKQLGRKVILIGTSTGCTLALKLAAEFPNDVAGLVLYSPNIAINDPFAFFLNNHWGLQIARLKLGGNYFTPDDTTAIYARYWNTPYRLEALTQLQEMLETTCMPETFEKIKQPCLILYYYKDELHQDIIVKVSAIKEMAAQLGTPESAKKLVAMPDAGNHVLTSPLKSQDVEGVIKETERFLAEMME